MENKLQYLFKLLTLNIPEVEEPENGFLEIISKSHHENIISSIYAYYLDRENGSGYSSIFLNSIIELASNKLNRKIEITDYEVHTELRTKSGKRIDIAIADHKNRTAILIENKIYHKLNNDLEDYWNHFGFPDENQLGIVLTLNHTKIDNDLSEKFANITHNVWIERIKSSRVTIQAWNKHQVYLTDFFQTLKNLTTKINMDELAKFYFQHAKVLRSATYAIKHGEDFLLEQQKLLAAKLELSHYSISHLEYVNYWDEKNKRETFYTVLFEDLVDGKFKLTIIIELEGKDIALIPKIENELKDDEDYKSFEKNSVHFKKYVHLLQKDYSVNEKDLAKLADFIYDKIQVEFDPVMKKILKIVDKNKIASA